MIWIQKEIRLRPVTRGFHIITHDIISRIPELAKIEIGICQIFICHTSASITLNENASWDVPIDLEDHFARMVPEEDALYRHTTEGSDDMPAHLKSSILGSSVTCPITHGKLNLGIWQGVFLCEHRNSGGSRKLVVTLFGKG